MDDVHQKTILLKHTTVKVPGKRPPKATTPAQGKTVKLIRCYLQLLLCSWAGQFLSSRRSIYKWVVANYNGKLV